MKEYLKELDYIKLWHDLVLFSNTLIGQVCFRIILVSLCSLSVKIALEYISNKIGIIQHLNHRKLEKLKAYFDIAAMMSNIILGIIISHLYEGSIYLGLIYGFGSILLHFYIESGMIGDNLKFIFRFINPKTLLKKWLKSK